MTLYKYTFDGGAVGSALASGQSGSGSPLSAVTPTSGATLTYDTTHAAHGAQSVKVVGSTGQARFDYNISSTSVAARAYVWIDTLPTADTFLLRFDAGGVRQVSFHINSAGKLRLSDASGTTGVWTAAATFPLGQWVRIGIFCKVGTGTTDGTLTAAAYLGDSTTPIEAAYSSTARNTGTAPITAVGGGKTNTGTYASPFWVDEYAVDDAATGLIGPWVAAANATPTANAGPDQSVEPWSTVTLDGSSSADSDGTIASYAWTQTAGPAVTLSGTGAIRTFTAPASMAGTTHTFGLTVTDNGGATSTQDTVVVNVLPATEFVRSGGAWSPRRPQRRQGGFWV